MFDSGRLPEKTRKRPTGTVSSISTRPGSSKYSTPDAHTPTPTVPAQATPGQRACSVAYSASACGA